MAQLLSLALNKNDKSLHNQLLLDINDANLIWYEEISVDKKQPILFSDNGDPKNATNVVAYLPKTKHLIEENYNFKLTRTFGDVNFYTLSGPKR